VQFIAGVSALQLMPLNLQNKQVITEKMQPFIPVQCNLPYFKEDSKCLLTASVQKSHLKKISVDTWENCCLEIIEIFCLILSFIFCTE
jgi:hypothetical protein